MMTGVKKITSCIKLMSVLNMYEICSDPNKFENIVIGQRNWFANNSISMIHFTLNRLNFLGMAMTINMQCAHKSTAISSPRNFFIYNSTV